MRIKTIGRALVVLLPVLLAAGPAAAQRRGDMIKEIHQTYPFEKTGRINLENINGDVEIDAWDRAEVKVDAVISAYSQERLDEVEVDIDVRSNRLYIETRYPQRDWGGWDRDDQPARVDYTLTVPRTAALDDIELINGSIDLKGVEGEVTASSINGRIVAEGLAGRSRISTINGDMDLVWERVNRSTPMEITSVNGRIRITLPSDADARINAHTVHGHISNDFNLPVSKGRFVGRELAGRLGSGEGRIELSNVNGTVTIRRANDGRPQSQVENLLREEKDDDWQWDDDRDDKDDEDFDWDDDEDSDDDDDDE